MKKGPAILVLSGLAILIALSCALVTPKEDTGATDTDLTQDEAHDPDAEIDKALSQLQSGEVAPMQAVLTIRNIAEEHPENLKAQYTLGMLSIQSGQYDKAIGRFEKVLQIDSTQADAYSFLAQAYTQLGDTASANNIMKRGTRYMESAE
tara:strand:- start:16 stop:465 length:450 start_codon:yes stop_codon:yes gene_type:complete